MLAEWLQAFAVEAGVPASPDAYSSVEKSLASERLFVWEDGGPASMARWAGPTPTGVRVGPVYTPPERRGRGYASACVAALSQRLLDGRAFCALFTDLDNPVSNRIYRRIGYEPVCDFAQYQFANWEVARCMT